jgi:two-component system alkaline phosphatase synthesis response regulator PhoP
MKQRILLVEDEEHLMEAIMLNLEMEGYEVIPATDGLKAIKYFKSAKYDLVILDVMLPEMDGYNVCKNIRIENQHTPILFLTPKNTTQDKVEGLKIGADDFMTKPFDLEEFLLRVQLLIKRTKRFSNENLHTDLFSFNGFVINFQTYEVYKSDVVLVQLSKKEVQLLKLLSERANEVVSRDSILENVWGYEVYPTSRTIDNFILNFRKYFEENPKNPKYFHSIRGVGYRFSPSEN